MKLSYDLHIHSCLSPCGDEDMTPANIVGMAALKGLDVIAVTDHNSCKNCPAVLAAAGRHGLLAVPGMEICTSEEVHAVCLFPDLEAALRFDAYVYGLLEPFPNNEKIFGRQVIYDGEDRETGSVPLLLINRTRISFQQLWPLVRAYGGAVFPAHIDKGANSLISNLGFVPPDSRFRAAEVSDPASLPGLRLLNPYLKRCRIVRNSDAHELGRISEPGPVMTVESKTAWDVVEWLQGPGA